MTRAAISVATPADPDPLLDPRFGRAEAFLVLDETGQVVQRVSNPHRNAGHGAGPAVAGWMRDLGVETVISGEFGPKALASLNALGITPLTAPPGLRVSEAHRRFTEGTLERKATRGWR
ncbi:MAG: NifB/NifX family molybdenum-iron cluster-binding protein [Deltaproteobacteria bacterium]|nr:NifB/NifX family molybdenum-iron cluster-binding protein [Deltaproteobacteria bacterium]